MSNRIHFQGSWSRVLVCLGFILLQSAQRSHSFVVPPTVTPRHASVSFSSPKSTSIPLSMLPPLLTTTSIWKVAMEVFDASSSMINPVVVSEVVWTSFRVQLIAVTIGPILTTAILGALLWLVTSKLPSLGNSPLSNNNNNNNNNSGGFNKATDNSGFTNPTTTVASQKITPDFGKLLICLAIDIMGSSSEVIPIMGGLADIVYAPLAATVLRNLYGSNNILFDLEFLEEILPFTDILPLPTIW